MKHALEIGHRHVDFAFVYEIENEVGEGIKAAMEEFKVEREDIWVTIKFCSVFHHTDDIEGACKQSLKNLNLDYLDVYLIHWPIAFKRGEGNFSQE